MITFQIRPAILNQRNIYITLLIFLSLAGPAGAQEPQLMQPLGSKGIIFSMFSPDGKFILSSTQTGSLYYRETASGKLIRIFSGHLRAPSWARFSRDGRYLLSCNGELIGNALLWDVSTGALLLKDTANEERPDEFFFLEGTHKVVNIGFASRSLSVFDADSTRLLYHSGGDDTTRKFYNSGNRAYSLVRTEAGCRVEKLDPLSLEWKPVVSLRDTAVNDSAWKDFFSYYMYEGDPNCFPDHSGKWLGLRFNMTLRLYDLHTGLRVTETYADILSFNSNESHALFLIKNEKDGPSRLWSVTGRKWIWEGKNAIGIDEDRLVIQTFVYDKKSNWETTVSCLNPLTGEPVWNLSRKGKLLVNYLRIRPSYFILITNTHINPDFAEQLLIRKEDGRVAGTFTGKADPGGILLPDEEINVTISGDLMVTSTDSTVRVWNIPQQKLVREAKGDSRAPASLSFAPGDRYLFTGNKIIDIQTGKTISYIPGEPEMISENDDRVIMNTADGLYALYDLQNGRLLKQLPGGEPDDLETENDNLFVALEKDSLLWTCDLQTGELHQYLGSIWELDGEEELLLTSTASYPPEEEDGDEEDPPLKIKEKIPLTFIYDFKKGKLVKQFPGALIRAEKSGTDTDSTGQYGDGFRYLLLAMPDSSSLLYYFHPEKTIRVPGAYRKYYEKEGWLITSDKSFTYLTETGSGKLKAKIPGRFEDRLEPEDKLADHYFILTASGKDRYQLWNTESGKTVYSFSSAFPVKSNSISISPDGKSLILIRTPPARIGETKRIDCYYEGKFVSADTADNYSVDSSFRYLAVLVNMNKLRARDLKTGELLREFTAREDNPYQFTSVYKLGNSPVFKLIGKSDALLYPQKKQLLRNFFGYSRDYRLGYQQVKGDTLKIHDFSKGTQIAFYAGDYTKLVLSDSQDRIYINFRDSLRVFDVSAEDFVKTLPGTYTWDYGGYVFTLAGDSSRAWQEGEYRLAATLKGRVKFYRKEKELIVALAGNTAWVYRNFQFLSECSLPDKIKSVSVHESGKIIKLTDSGDRGTAFLAETGQPVHPVEERLLEFGQATFILAGNDEKTSVYDPENGKLMMRAAGELQNYSIKEKRYFITRAGDSLFTWDALTGKRVKATDDSKDLGVIAKSKEPVYELVQTGHETSFIRSRDSTFRSAPFSIRYKLPEGRLYGRIVDYFCVSPDRKLAFISQHDFAHQVIDLVTGRVTDLSDPLFYENFNQGTFTANNEFLVTTSMYGVSWNERIRNYSVWNCRTGKRIIRTGGKSQQELLYAMSRDTHYFVIYADGLIRIYSLKDGKLLYQYLDLDRDNSLVSDAAGHYDGSPQARSLPYFTCGNEIIELDQVKDQLWVPGLAERIMKGDSILAKNITELNICGLTPEVDNRNAATGDYFFRITPRRGGLGETVVFVNGIEVMRFKPAQLRKNGEVYELELRRADLQPYFVSGFENPVTIKSFTADNTISSRGAILTVDQTNVKGALPNLYAVMVGVSDYKGRELDLNYAAKDATDLSRALAISAGKLLNIDGKEHVFMYNLTTSDGRYLLPEKNGVRKVMEEIGKKATANDILLIFFAGHGVMTGDADKKQFYFLTADASSLAVTEATREVGISTSELIDWMKPQHIKAQKRILIFDACNSGQAINDIAGVNMMVRNDDRAQQIKAVDKLNEKSGLFILSASASTQNAYEMGRYSQGLLTYSLLKAIKQQPDILEEGKYLNLSRWFNEAGKTVSELSRENGARQEPQIATNTNFNIGVVDRDVMAKIVLPEEKPLFAASIFLNSDEAIGDDDLELSKLINLQLSDIAGRGATSKIVYVTATNDPDAWSLSGRYDIKGKLVTVKVNLKQNKEIKQRFVLSGTKDKLNELAASVAEKAAGLTAVQAEKGK